MLALRGDKSQNEKRFMPHPQGHAHAVDLVRQIADMNRGKFIDGEVEECHHSKFSIGVAGYPEVHAEARDITSDIARLRDKVDAGAEYVITQMFFDNAKYFDFVRRCREAGITVPIIPGIKPLSTLRHLEILPETFGVKLPEELVREVKAHPDGVREVGTESVSYTHLDVYKRQSYLWGRNAPACRGRFYRAVRNSVLIPSGFSAAFGVATPLLPAERFYRTARNSVLIPSDFFISL